jgi:hypothetical protein
LEAGIRCTADIARFSNDSVWAATLKHINDAMRKIFIFLHALFSIRTFIPDGEEHASYIGITIIDTNH